MRIETLLQDKAVSEAFLALELALLRARTDTAEADKVPGLRAALVTALLAALAGEGETEALDAAALAIAQNYYGDPRLTRLSTPQWQKYRHHAEAAAPLLTAPLLARVATLEAELGGTSEANWCMRNLLVALTSSNNETVEAAARKEALNFLKGWHGLTKTTDWTRSDFALALATVSGRLSTVEAERDRLREAATNLRAAQRAYMANRGNDELGRAVAAAAQAMDDTLLGETGR